MWNRLLDWLLADHRRRMAQLHANLDDLEERFVAMRADLFARRGRGN